MYSSTICGSVVDPDPDPRIRVAALWIRLRILFFSSIAFKVPTKNTFFYICLLRKKVIKRSPKQQKSRFFLLVLLEYGRIRIWIQIRIRTNNDGSGSGFTILIHCFVGHHIKLHKTEDRNTVEQKMLVWTVSLVLGKIVDRKHFLVNI
jgi:hypothetical protein